MRLLSDPGGKKEEEEEDQSITCSYTMYHVHRIFRANCDRDRSKSERFSVGEISHLSKISSMPLCKACPGCGGMVNVRKVSCSCGHVFITKRSKPRLTAKSGSRKHTMSSFRALETDEQAADRMSVDRACKAKKRVLETEEEAFERKSHDRASKGNKRALETEQEALERKSHDRACKGKKRALETEKEAFERKSHDSNSNTLFVCAHSHACVCVC